MIYEKGMTCCLSDNGAEVFRLSKIISVASSQQNGFSAFLPAYILNSVVINSWEGCVVNELENIAAFRMCSLYAYVILYRNSLRLKIQHRQTYKKKMMPGITAWVRYSIILVCRLLTVFTCALGPSLVTWVWLTPWWRMDWRTPSTTITWA